MKSKTKKSPFAKRILYVLLPFILPLCLIALGILLLVNDTLVTNVFIALGILIALIGLIEVVIYVSRRKYEVQPRYLVSGTILLIIGVALIIIPVTVNTLIPVLIGICVLASGISGIMNTMSFRQENSNILVPLLFAITNCLLGIFILIYVLLINKSSGWNIIGILMIISGVLRILNELLARIAVPNSTGVTEEKTNAEPIEVTDWEKK